MLRKYDDIAINEFYEKISASPCFSRHLESAISGGICLYCDGIKRLSLYSGGLCMECQSQVKETLIDNVTNKWRVSVSVTEKN